MLALPHGRMLTLDVEAAEDYLSAQKAWLGHIAQDCNNVVLLENAVEFSKSITRMSPSSFFNACRRWTPTTSSGPWNSGCSIGVSRNRRPRPRRCRSSNGHTPWPAAKALPQLERAYSLAEGRYRGVAAAQAGRAALTAGEQETARAYAEIMLSSNLGTVGAFTTATSPWAAWRWPKETSRKQRVACSRRAEPREAGHSVRSVPTWRWRNICSRRAKPRPYWTICASCRSSGRKRSSRTGSPWSRPHGRRISAPISLTSDPQDVCGRGASSRYRASSTTTDSERVDDST